MLRENLSLGFPTRSDTNQAVQPQKIARGLKFCTSEVEGLYKLCSENKGADQLGSYCAADQHLVFAYAKSQISPDAAHLRLSSSENMQNKYMYNQNEIKT